MSTWFSKKEEETPKYKERPGEPHSPKRMMYYSSEQDKEDEEHWKKTVDFDMYGLTSKDPKERKLHTDRVAVSYSNQCAKQEAEHAGSKIRDFEEERLEREKAQTSDSKGKGKDPAPGSGAPSRK